MEPKKHRLIFIILSVLILGGVLYYVIPRYFSSTYVRGTSEDISETKNEEIIPSLEEPILPGPIPITHITTPEPMKALYMTSWVAGTQSMRNHVLDIAEGSEINAILFDIKDYTGRVSYPAEDPELVEIGSSEKRITNLREYTNLLHSKGLYVIGRVASFQDPYFVKLHPEYAVKTASDKARIWADRKGITWIDAGQKEVWEYLVRIANDAYAQGVDEIQFDYIRYPSDGNMKDIYFPVSDGKVKQEVLREFFEYIHANLGGKVPISADLFGMTATNTDDLGIGQNLEYALLNFDFVCPMVYPSHFPPNWNGYKNPQAVPRDVILASMSEAARRATAIGVSPLKLRPWLQYFGLYGMKYTAAEIRAQIQGTYDSGLTSWLLWDPSNKYAHGGILSKEQASSVLE